MDRFGLLTETSRTGELDLSAVDRLGGNPRGDREALPALYLVLQHSLPVGPGVRTDVPAADFQRRLRASDIARCERGSHFLGLSREQTVLFFQGKYHLYPAGDNRSYHVYTSADLVHWAKGPKVFQAGERNVWAPDVSYQANHKKSYLYCTVNKRIGVAVADRPEGTFADRGTLFKSATDAHLFCDQDGKCFLYYVRLPGSRICVQQMKTPLSKEGRPLEIITPSDGKLGRSLPLVVCSRIARCPIRLARPEELAVRKRGRTWSASRAATVPTV